MSVRALIERLVRAGMDAIDAAEVVAEAMCLGAAEAAPKKSSGAVRTQRWREKRASQNVTGDAQESADKAVTNHHETSRGDALTRVRDINPNSEITGNLSLSLTREWAGDALADMARAPGIASLHGLTAAMRGKDPCTLEDIEAGVRSAAAWYRAKRGPGRMSNWDLAVKMAGEARDRRLSGAPPAAEVVQLRTTGPPQSYAEKSAEAWDYAMRKIAEDG